MQSRRALSWGLVISLALLCACTQKHTFSDGHVIEIAGNENYWFRWIMLGMCALLALVVIGLAIAGHGVRVGVYALPFAIGAVLLYPGMTTPRQRSLDKIEAYQARLDARGGLSWKSVAKEAPALAASLQARLDTDVAAFEKAMTPKLAASKVELRPLLEALAKDGVITFADLQKRAESGDARAKKAITSIDRAARLSAAVLASKTLRDDLSRSAKDVTALAALAGSDNPPRGAAARAHERRLEAARDLAEAPLPTLGADPTEDHRRALFESIIGPPPAEKPL